MPARSIPGAWCMTGSAPCVTRFAAAVELGGCHLLVAGVQTASDGATVGRASFPRRFSSRVTASRVGGGPFVGLLGEHHPERRARVRIGEDPDDAGAAAEGPRETLATVRSGSG